ncbi:nodulin MtN21/EamA-like transporter family protein, putative [Medicago truncatula]|uniref:Nodulin MtN21/EamA-like transporter family protein, putative n=1 Tax=Medicago truncatula TaxID=3880 RepID=A0A072UQD9_MEDTR|nr:nodulin MtN21/EamA-like transporter family protein, putative [Medicago truncatula]
MNMFAEGMTLTSSTFMFAMFNLTPGITFIMAIFFGLEKLNWSVVEGKAKVIGTLMGISGAMVLTFYKGAEINIWSSNINLLHNTHHQNQNGHMELQHADFSNKLLGFLYAIGSSCSFSLWFIIQATVRVPLPLSSFVVTIPLHCSSSRLFYHETSLIIAPSKTEFHNETSDPPPPS